VTRGAPALPCQAIENTVLDKAARLSNLSGAPWPAYCHSWLCLSVRDFSVIGGSHQAAFLCAVLFELSATERGEAAR